MLRQTSPKAASGSTGFAMLPSAHRKPERRDSKAFKMETQFNTGRAWFLSVALLLGTLGFVLVDHSSRTANLRGHLHAKHARANEQIATLKTRLRGQLATETAAKAEAQASAEAAKQEAAEGKRYYDGAADRGGRRGGRAAPEGHGGGGGLGVYIVPTTTLLGLDA